MIFLKIFLTNGTVQLQRRDIALLAKDNDQVKKIQDIIEMEDQCNEFLAYCYNERFIKPQEDAFFEISDSKLVSYLKNEQRVTDLLDYLTYSAEELSLFTDQSEQLCALYSQKQDRYLSQAHYDYACFSEMLYQKSTGKLLHNMPVKYDKDTYYQTLGNRFVSVATNVQDLYLLRDLSISFFALRDEELQMEFEQMREKIALGISATSKKSVDPASLLLIPSKEKKGHVLVKR